MSSARSVNLLVIGRSPRPALEAEFRRVLGADVELHTIGALDGLSDEEISAAPPQSGADTLYTTLPDGSSTLLSKKLVTRSLVARVKTMPLDGRDTNVLCCTGRFAELSETGVFSASDLLAHAVCATVAAGQRLGVFIPKAEQADHAAARWAEKEIETRVVALAPDADAETIDRAANEMAAANVDRVVYDCMSYSTALRQRADAIHHRPGCLAVTTAARFVAELHAL